MSVCVQAESFNLQDEISRLSQNRQDIGAIVSFTGLVRDKAKGRQITKMHLEHYPGMAEKELNQIVEKAKQQWPLQAVRLVHRYGTLAPGELIVCVITMSAHREAAFHAAQYIMDYLKTDAPFWKKEYFTNIENGEWVAAKQEDKNARENWQL